MEKTIHLRYQGLSREVELNKLNLPNNFSDIDLVRSLASHYDLDARKMDNDCVVDRGTDGIVVRPHAVYG